MIDSPGSSAASSAAAGERVAAIAYLGAIVCLVLARAALTHDLPLIITYAPHDDSLYVMRAFHLLQGEAFGPYDSRTLAKLPGMSFWLAGARTLGLPHQLGVEALYLLAGLYMLSGLARAGAGRLLRASAFALYVLNPVTMGADWLRVLREPLGTGLFVVQLAAMLHLLAPSRARPWPHVALLAIGFAFSLLLREDDRLLWGLLAAFALALLRAGTAWPVVLAALLAPAGGALLAEQAARAYVQTHYGLPILHDMSEGEFPRMMAAIRGIESGTDNRLVMAPQKTLQQLRAEVPQFAPVVDALPPVGRNTLSCRLQGVCSEWSNGWMPFWIKDAAAGVGSTPDLKAAQSYFGGVREGIERACGSGALECAHRGGGLIPPFELRWTRALVAALAAIAGMALAPDPYTVTEPPLLYNVPPRLGRAFHSVTMTDSYDSQVQAGATGAPEARAGANPFAAWRAPLAALLQPLAALVIVAGFAALLWRWALHPDVPESPLFWIAAVFFAFALLRLAALAHVSVFLGPFDSRIVFSVYSAALLLAPAALADAWRARRAARAAGLPA